MSLYPSILEQVKQVLLEIAASQGQSGDLEDDTDLLARGVIDSLGMMRALVAFEATFRIEFDNEELLLEHFATPRLIAERIFSKLQAVA